MKYSTDVTIALPRDRVIELFDNPDNLPKWMKGLQSFAHLSGTPGEAGAQSKLVFQMGKRRVEMIETITERALPERFSGTYEAKGVWNSVRNEFSEKPGGETHWLAHHEFRFKGFMKIIAFFMGGAFQKQTQETMVDFKNFAEQEGSRDTH
jgi:uncharacterized membrane protein